MKVSLEIHYFVKESFHILGNYDLWQRFNCRDRKTYRKCYFKLILLKFAKSMLALHETIQKKMEKTYWKSDLRFTQNNYYCGGKIQWWACVKVVKWLNG